MQRSASFPANHDPVPLRRAPVERAESRMPVPSTRFLGREAEIAAVCAMLRGGDARLVTLVGPGGVGKTRLAIEVATVMAPGFPDGVRYVGLAGVLDPALVASEIARAAGDRNAGPGIGVAAATAAFGELDCLLVLDNFEQVVEAAPLLSELLDVCPGITFLVTSRTALRLSAERAFPVPPLPVPAADFAASIDELEQSAAVQLFVDRARARSHDFALTTANAASVSAICDALDGLPLGIVLAAAHIDLMTPESLLSRLRQRLPLLDRGPVDFPDRHRSVDAAIDWSYDLLDAPARSALRRLAVCVDGFTLDAAAAVLGFGSDPLDRVATLVGGSLLTVAQSTAGETRYMMLGPIREYALRRLAGDDDTTPLESGAESAEEVDARNRHAAFYGDLAEWSDWAWFMVPSEGEPRLARLESETANIRAALEWLHRRGDHLSLLGMAACLGSLWVVLGHPREGVTWLESGLREGRDIPDSVRGRALATMSWCVNTVGDPVRALDLAEESVAILQTLDEPLHLARAQILAGVPAYRIEGRQREADTWFEQAQATLVAVEAPEWVPNMRAMVTSQLGHAALIRGDIPRAHRFLGPLQEAEALRGYKLGESHVFGASMAVGLADLARANGDPATALDLYKGVLSLARQYRNFRGICSAMAGVAGSLAALGAHEPAARVFGASEAFHEQLDYEFAEYFDRQRAFGLPEPWLRAAASFGPCASLRAALLERVSLPPIRDPGAAAAAWAEGRAMSLDDAIELALAARPPVTAHRSDASFGLSAREVEVLRLLADGATDAEIAEALFISRRTAATHIRHIYDKLGLSSRAGAAAWAVRNGLA